ncbi:MAG: type II toxin-antitoxin system VapC family toxin [Salinarimonas sp.]
MIVLDSSMTLSWFFEDEQTPAGTAVLQRLPNLGAIAPSLWKLEVANALATAVRRKRCTPDFADLTLSRLRRMRIQIDGSTAEHAWEGTRMLSLAHGLTIYEATYLEVSVRLQLPLATCDGRLAAAARACAIEVIDAAGEIGS